MGMIHSLTSGKKTARGRGNKRELTFITDESSSVLLCLTIIVQICESIKMHLFTSTCYNITHYTIQLNMEKWVTFVGWYSIILHHFAFSLLPSPISFYHFRWSYPGSFFPAGFVSRICVFLDSRETKTNSERSCRRKKIANDSDEKWHIQFSRWKMIV